MSFDTLRVETVLFLRWLLPTVEDNPSVLRAVQEAYQTVGRPIVYVVVVPKDSPPPPEDLRKAMAGHMESMLEWCESIHLVFEGEGFGHTVKRIVVASILLVSGAKGRVFVHSSLDELVKGAPKGSRLATTKAVEFALRRGFFEAPVRRSRRAGPI